MINFLKRILAGPGPVKCGEDEGDKVDLKDYFYQLDTRDLEKLACSGKVIVRTSIEGDFLGRIEKDPLGGDFRYIERINGDEICSIESISPSEITPRCGEEYALRMYQIGEKYFLDGVPIEFFHKRGSRVCPNLFEYFNKLLGKSKL